MNRSLLVLVLHAGCSTWHHAPGYADREAMTKQEIRGVNGAFCHFGACDKHGPNGRVRFSDVWFLTVDEVRTQTRFEIAYDGLRARCRQLSDPERPFVCSIAGAVGPRYDVALERGCASGTVTISGQLGAPPAYAIQTDTVAIAGRSAPGREVALLDETGVLALTTVHARDNVDLFTRPGSALASAQLLIMLGVHAFLELEHGPALCTSA